MNKAIWNVDEKLKFIKLNSTIYIPDIFQFYIKVVHSDADFIFWLKSIINDKGMASSGERCDSNKKDFLVNWSQCDYIVDLCLQEEMYFYYDWKQKSKYDSSSFTCIANSILNN